MLPIVEVEGAAGAALAAAVTPLADGPIAFSAERFRAGTRPAVEWGGPSVLIGPSSPAMKLLAKRVLLDYAVLGELEAFAALGTKLDRATRAQIDHGRRVAALLGQPPGRPMSVEDQVLVLYAGTAGHLDRVPLEQVRAFEEGLVAHAHARHAGALHDLDRPRLTPEALRQLLDPVIEDFKSHFGCELR
jgi:F-type H+-transporting ATPase subunit alpha